MSLGQVDSGAGTKFNSLSLIALASLELMCKQARKELAWEEPTHVKTDKLRWQAIEKCCRILADWQLSRSMASKILRIFAYDWHDKEDAQLHSQFGDDCTFRTFGLNSKVCFVRSLHKTGVRANGKPSNGQ